MNKRIVLKDAGVLLIAVVMVLSTVVVTGNKVNTSTVGPYISNDDGISWHVSGSDSDNSIVSESLNNPPVPPTPTGPTEGDVDVSYTYCTSNTGISDDVFFLFDWDDGTNSGWIGPYPAGSSLCASHTWSTSGTYCIKVKAKDSDGNESGWSGELCVSITGGENNPPETPSKPSGPTNGEPGVQYMYSTSTTDPDDDRVKYGWDFDGDDIVEPGHWTDLMTSGAPCTVGVTFAVGTYHIQVIVEDELGAQSGFSPTLTVTIGEGGFIGTVEPQGQATVTEIPGGDGWTVGNCGFTGDDGIGFTPEPAHTGFTYSIPYSTLDELPEGAIITTVYQCSDGSDITTQLESTGNVKTYSQSVSNMDEGIIVVYNGGDIVFQDDLGPDGNCGLFESTGNVKTYSQSISNMDEGIIAVDINWNGDTVTWTWKGETYDIDALEVNGMKPDLGDIIGCSVYGTFPMGLQGAAMMNPGEFTVTHVRSSDAPDTPTITGKTSGKPDTEYTYNLKSTDPNGDNVYYLIYWGDGTTSGWTGPYKSGNTTPTKHTWGNKGDYIIRVKARDSNRIESDWATLPVSMPKNRAINTMPLFLRFLQQHPCLFPILQILLQRFELM